MSETIIFPKTKEDLEKVLNQRLKELDAAQLNTDELKAEADSLSMQMIELEVKVRKAHQNVNASKRNLSVIQGKCHELSELSFGKPKVQS